MNRFIDYKTMISEKRKISIHHSKRRYLWQKQTALTGGAFWTLNRGETFFFDIFGLDGLKGFIIQDGKKVVEKILFGTEQLIRTGNKITLVNRKFNLNAC